MKVLSYGLDSIVMTVLDVAAQIIVWVLSNFNKNH